MCDLVFPGTATMSPSPMLQEGGSSVKEPRSREVVRRRLLGKSA